MTKNVYIPLSGNKLKGTIFYPPTLKAKNPAILFIHGWTSNEAGYAPRAEALSQLGFICLTFNLQGHDGDQKNINKFSRAEHLKNCIAAYDFLYSQKEVDKKKIGGVGASYGGYLGAILSEKRKLKWLVLRAPALYQNVKFNIPTSQLLQEREKSFFQKFNPKEDNFALVAIKNFKGNLLLIESEKDQIIPSQIIKYYQSAKADKTTVFHQVIKHANHQLSTNEYKQAFINILVAWFNKNYYE